ncbi:sugar ABC transporter permease [Telmatospirillum sp.]|uniref:carbohydrate ABC transporter permease n=1 Tax=Telmatospirillum sp. TaxID=2079197 RepID=UPI0028401F4F|nr:sugar ABC transporter permease [Telmatospirillum sp.]MDR3436213.1 sugar ABC transporter permease [Telmatospirillum sp.]
MTRPTFKADEMALAAVFVLPILVIMGGLVFYPLAVSTVDSFYRVDPMRPDTPFVGFANYARLVTDSTVQASWFNTLAYVVFAVVLETLGGLGAALLLDRIRHGRRWLLAITVLPWCLPPVVNAIVWMWIFNPSYGLLNKVLLGLGLIAQNKVWFNDQATALFLVSLVHVWRMMPLTAVILLAALQSIPGELYEAAKLDGAGPVKSFRLVTLPLIAGGLAIALSQSTVFAFNLFDEAWILAGSSIDTRSVIIQVYLTAFQSMRLSSGMALSILAMIGSLAVSLVYVLKVYRETRYD